MKEETHTVDLCVVGGGMAGLIAALAAARRGARVALVHDRPVLGGNASSEIRMHICGAHGRDNRETGILEEILLENHYRNPQPNFSIWDSVLHGKAMCQEGLELFMNCSVDRCATDGARVRSVTGWQLTTETWHTIEASLFADCSGDGILAPLSGAEYRIGREARSEFDESIAPERADRKTMGMSCLFQAREYGRPQRFIPPDWAYRFTKPEDLRGRHVDVRRTNYWWIEVGGEMDSIHDAERCRDELLKIAFGVWDYVKDHGGMPPEEVANWALDWVGFLPGKRESRRYVGDHVLTQNDVRAEGRFDDLVAYGGWTMDDHFPAGFYHPEAGTIFHPGPSPFGIPYRSLYSRNIENLFCAGRCHSASHAAMSATRVMGTTSLMGQAVGTAAAIATRDGLTPRGVLGERLRELQEFLLDDDCYLPWRARAVPGLTRGARLVAEHGDPEPLRSGIGRPVGGADNGWTGPVGTAVDFEFDGPVPVKEVRLVFDSDLNRVDTSRGHQARNMRHYYALDADPWRVPGTLVRRFRVDTLGASGEWSTAFREANNYERLVRVPLAVEARAVRFVPEETWGADEAHVFALDVR
ncbi:MAG: FAD-dependent oxidoreductase [Planctomycetota bacterium]